MNPQTPSRESLAALDATAADAPEAGGTAEPAGRITLSGRDRTTARARALAGLALGTGLVAILNDIDTTVSLPILPL
ncbi:MULTISPECIES: hypothetical protein [Streptomyces]|uniref:MFS transporter n=2 Tax=Streptomyces TaxID=1883 RepID=A0ABU4K051_9ACTN|nr:hypothetical protein [Streptomyces roseolus]MDX2291140.1 hypothetical protein [Streptomyces roseolus]